MWRWESEEVSLVVMLMALDSVVSTLPVTLHLSRKQEYSVAPCDTVSGSLFISNSCTRSYNHLQTISDKNAQRMGGGVAQ